MEAARSVREDFLHQNGFDDIDTFTPLKKQYYMLAIIMDYFTEATAAVNRGVRLQRLLDLPVMERIGRFKMTPPEDIVAEYENLLAEMRKQIREIED